VVLGRAGRLGFWIGLGQCGSLLAELRFLPAIRRGLTTDPDAIDDARLERSLVIHYFERPVGDLVYDAGA